jgi:putative SOS response-associated peptidase YedK
MCGRYILRRINARRFGVEFTSPGFEEFSETRLMPRFNIAPSQLIPAIRIDRSGRRGLGGLRWGLIPHWAKGRPKSQPINARGETVASSGMFREAFERRRCLIPADGFYEWKKTATGKQPYLIRLADDTAFAFAGIWERWKSDEGAEPVETCAILTTEPNELMAGIHNRMPVILDEAEYARWLDHDVLGKDVAGLLRPRSADDMIAMPVSRAVNNARNDGPECIEGMTD